MVQRAGADVGVRETAIRLLHVVGDIDVTEALPRVSPHGRGSVVNHRGLLNLLSPFVLLRWRWFLCLMK
jgi:hypothetical protein